MFRCLVIRHAAAETEADSGLDEDRMLTTAGTEDMGRAAIALVRLAPQPELIAASPYERARATADILAREYGDVPVETVEALTAGAGPEHILAWLGQRRGRMITLVGHEPDLGRFVSLALAGVSRSFYPMRKGGACLLEFPAVPRAGNATLEWALNPSHLIAIDSSVQAGGDRPG